MGAAYDSRDRSPPPRCLPGTREEVLKTIDAWLKAGTAGESVLWLHGPAGAGKSAIAQTVAETCAGRNQLAASFFFARTAAYRNDAKYLFPTIAVQTALSVPEKRQRLDEILNNDPYAVERASSSVELLASLLDDRSVHAPRPSSPLLVVIDGLDECQRNDDQCWILTQVSRMIYTQHLPLRFLIVSRPEFHLTETFKERDLLNITKVLPLYGDYGASHDVSLYLRSELSKIYNAKKHKNVMQLIPRPWPSEDIIERLVIKTGGYFFFASAVLRFIDKEYSSPADQLDQILGLSKSSLELNPFAELDQLYIQILSSYRTSQLPTLKNILGHIIMSPVFKDRSLYLPSIEHILDLAPGELELTLRGLRSLVSPTPPLYGMAPEAHLIHASFGDFLLDRARAGHYYIDSEEWIHTTFHCAFSLACRSLDPHDRPSQPLEG